MPPLGAAPNKREHCSIPFLGIVQEVPIPQAGCLRQTVVRSTTFNSHGSLRPSKHPFKHQYIRTTIRMGWSMPPEHCKRSDNKRLGESGSTANGPSTSRRAYRQHRSLHRDCIRPYEPRRLKRRRQQNVDGSRRHQRICSEHKSA